MIELRGVTVVFGRTIALDEISLQIPTGVTGLFGQNGSGKSTLLRVVTGLLPADRGEVLVDGARLNLRNEDFRRRIGYAGHRSGLYGRLTVHENLQLFARLYGTSPGRVTAMIEQLGLTEHAGTQAGALSAGYSRRAAVARALLHEPDLLMLDEPYANLDDEAAELVSSAVVGWRTGSRTAIVATHGAKKVKPYADAGLILQRGRVVRHGSYHAPGVAT